MISLTPCSRMHGGTVLGVESRNLCGSLALRGSWLREEKEVIRTMSAQDIENLGFDWPKYAVIEEYYVIEDGEVDLVRRTKGMRSSQACYRNQLDAAFTFKTCTGADHSDFTDRFADPRMDRGLGQAMSCLEEIIEAAEV